MSTSDCEKCWETPCTCGKESIIYMRDLFQSLIDDTYKYSKFKNEEVYIAGEKID